MLAFSLSYFKNTRHFLAIQQKYEIRNTNVFSARMKSMNDVFITSRFLFEITFCIHINHFDLLSDLNRYRSYENSNTINKSVMVRL